MTTDYVTAPPLPFLKLKGLKLGCVIEKPHKKGDMDLTTTLLTDGRNYLHAFCNRSGNTTFSCWGGNCVEDIIAALEKHFQIRFIPDDLEEDYEQAYETMKQIVNVPGQEFYRVGTILDFLNSDASRPTTVNALINCLCDGKLDPLVLRVVFGHRQGLEELIKAVVREERAAAWLSEFVKGYRDLEKDALAGGNKNIRPLVAETTEADVLRLAEILEALKIPADERPTTTKKTSPKSLPRRNPARTPKKTTGKKPPAERPRKRK